MIKKNDTNCSTFTHPLVYMINNEKTIEIHRALIEKCRKGDRDAQFEIYKLYFKPLYNTALRMLNNSMLAEEVMQDAMLAAFSKLDTFKGESTFGAWLKRIVVNKSLDELKKKRLEFVEINQNMGETLNSSNEEFSLYGSKAETVEKIRKAIMELPDNYRIVVSLYLLDSFNHDEIAQLIDIKAGTVRSLYARGKQKLIQILNDC